MHARSTLDWSQSKLFLVSYACTSLPLCGRNPCARAFNNQHTVVGLYSKVEKTHAHKGDTTATNLKAVIILIYYSFFCNSSHDNAQTEELLTPILKVSYCEKYKKQCPKVSENVYRHKY